MLHICDWFSASWKFNEFFFLRKKRFPAYSATSEWSWSWHCLANAGKLEDHQHYCFYRILSQNFVARFCFGCFGSRGGDRWNPRKYGRTYNTILLTSSLCDTNAVVFIINDTVKSTLPVPKRSCYFILPVSPVGLLGLYVVLKSASPQTFFTRSIWFCWIS